MKLIPILALSASAIIFTQTSLACLPIPREKFEITRERVKEKFDSVDSVELMTLLDERWVEIRMYGVDQPTKVLRATFRVDRVFKGDSKLGDLVVFDSSSMCLRSALGSDVFIPPGSKIKPYKPSREWIIYRKAAHQTASPETESTFWPNEIQHSPLTQPISEAKTEIKFLEELQSKIVLRQSKK